MRRWWWRVALIAVAAAGLLFGYRRLLPVYRVGYQSDLVMLGDLDGDQSWTNKDRDPLKLLLADPYAHNPLECMKADLNGNGCLDLEDSRIFDRLVQSQEPYDAEARALEAGVPFPRPRELYRYLSSQDYLNRPLNGLPYPGAGKSPLACLRKEPTLDPDSSYSRQLWLEARDEAIRFDRAYHKRMGRLSMAERAYAVGKIDSCNRLYAEGRHYDLLLELMGLVEDAETLTTEGQDPFVAKTLFFRDHLRELLASPKYAEFQAGMIPVQDVLGEMQRLLKEDLGLEVDLENLGPARGLGNLQNYLSRTEWQYYKTRTTTEHFEQLIRYAQHDRRYLRAVAKTSRKQTDLGVQNHNLPMVLLFREALRISGGDKKAAVGLLDEAIRIPFYWVKSIPRDRLPGALALENFLLPGNKEDGADKSRHWNVFGGISLYKSPQESLELAMRREIQDLREAQFSKECTTEFIRDTIANLNGIYYVVSMNPDLAKL